MVTDLLIGPGRLVSYFTAMIDEPPGKIGVVSQVGTVHPQEPLHLLKVNGSVPEFVTLNSHAPFPPKATVP